MIVIFTFDRSLAYDLLLFIPANRHFVTGILSLILLRKILQNKTDFNCLEFNFSKVWNVILSYYVQNLIQTIFETECLKDFN